jgi:hypothetical protein
MTTFKQAVKGRKTTTTNGMAAYVSTQNACVDLFFKIGALRNGDVTPIFAAAYAENPNLACSIALWARDIRQGAGERKVFRDILKYLENTSGADYHLVTLLSRTPEMGRWDDLLILEDRDAKSVAHAMIKTALEEGNALAAKWMPRKGDVARELREYLKMTPKQYRKTLVNLTSVVETQMCAKEWDAINFNHVPSVASSRYRKAFSRHTPKYAEWVAALSKPESGAKVNASAIFPHDVIGRFINYYSINTPDKVEQASATAQWKALPNYMQNGNILPIVDVSGSMDTRLGKSGINILQVAVSLGLYCADKNTGKFSDTFLTFSERPELLSLQGDIFSKITQMCSSSWSMSTNLEAAFDVILKTAKGSSVPQEEMPKTLLILSDMQFNCVSGSDVTAIQMIRKKYKNAGYELPNVVFWNLNAADSVPVSFHENGTALVSGYNPTILKSILAGADNMTPYGIMMQTIDNPRYQVG